PLRDRGPLLPRRRPARRGGVRRGHLHRGVPAARLPVRHQDGAAQDSPRLSSRGHVSRDDRGRNHQAGGRLVATTPETIAEQQALQGINADYEKRFGFHDPEHYLYKSPKGLNEEIVRKISEFKREP